MPLEVFGRDPVLPEEAQDLEKHVTKCATRYSNLARVIYRLQVTIWVYQALMYPAILYLIARLHGWTP